MAYVKATVWRWKGDFVVSVLSIHLFVGSANQNQVIQLRQQALLPPGILDGQTVGCVYACVFVICLII